MGGRRLDSVVSTGCCFSNERPVKRLKTNQPSNNAPTANSASPGPRSQRRFCIKPVCKNSAERAYQVPCSTDAHVCIKPIGNKENKTIAASPRLIDQKAAFNGHSFQTR